MPDKFTSSAKVIDGILILSLPDAITPVVWQMELGQSKSSATEIRTTEEGKFNLVLKTPRQDVLDIATYDDRAKAIKALLIISEAMEKSQGQLKKVSGLSPTPYPVPAVMSQSTDAAKGFLSFIIRLLKIMGAFFVAALLVIFVLFLISRVFLSADAPSASRSNAPISADEFLEGR